MYQQHLSRRNQYKYKPIHFIERQQHERDMSPMVKKTCLDKPAEQLPVWDKRTPLLLVPVHILNTQITNNPMKKKFHRKVMLGINVIKGTTQC